MESKKKKFKKKDQIKTVIIFAIIIVLLLWTINLFTLENDENRGTYGDMFGAVNALFSGFAFAGIIITIYYQSYQLELQRRDLLLTRKEMKRTRKEFESQSDTFKIQRFENTFFQMISLYHNLVEHLQVTNQDEYMSVYKGKDVFDYYKSEVERLVKKEVESVNRGKFKQSLDMKPDDFLKIKDLTSSQIIHFYDLIYSYNMNILGHYFRTVYHILKLINNTKNIDKKLYVSILRSQLSNSEQLILVYNCLHSNGMDKFKPLSEDYSLFQNIDRTTILSDNLIKDFKSNAFE